MIKRKKNVDTSISHYTVGKCILKCGSGFKLPVTIDDILKQWIRQLFPVLNARVGLWNRRLLGTIMRPVIKIFAIILTCHWNRL